MSPKSKEQIEIIRDKSINKILNSALNLFSKNGYSNTSMNEIAKYAKISKGLIYNYFTSKEELLSRVIKHGMESLYSEEEFITLFTVSDPKERFIGIMEATYIITSTKSEFLKIYMSLMFQPGIIEIIKEEFEEFTDGLFKMMETIFKDLGYKDPEKESKVFAAMLDGIQLHYLTTKDHYPLKEVMDFITMKYLREIESMKNDFLTIKI